MKKMSVVLWVLVASCLFCACGGKSGSGQDKILVEATEQVKEQQPLSATQETEEFIEELYDYRYVLPTETPVTGTSGGALFDMELCDLLLYKYDFLEFSSWEEVVEQCKDELSSAVYSAFRFWPTSQTAATETPFTNEHGVEMMRVTGELRENNNDPFPYIAYYYVTDENYVRFMLALNYEDEAKAAEVIDFVAERLEPLEKA